MARLPGVTGEVSGRLLSKAEQATGPLNRTRILAHCPEIAAGIAGWSDALAASTALDPLLRQIAILVVVRRSPYETARHVKTALSLGLDARAVEAFEEEDWMHPVFSEAQRHVFRYAMLFDGGYGVADEAFANLQKHLTTEQIVELSALCAHAGSMARLAIALGFDPETH